jgi:hypothetical protein
MLGQNLISVFKKGIYPTSSVQETNVYVASAPLLEKCSQYLCKFRLYLSYENEEGRIEFAA